MMMTTTTNFEPHHRMRKKNTERFFLLLNFFCNFSYLSIVCDSIQILNIPKESKCGVFSTLILHLKCHSVFFCCFIRFVCDFFFARALIPFFFVRMLTDFKSMVIFFHIYFFLYFVSSTYFSVKTCCTFHKNEFIRTVNMMIKFKLVVVVVFALCSVIIST